MDIGPLRFPKRMLTPAQAAKFAALREEIESELASRGRIRGRHEPARSRRMRRPWWTRGAAINDSAPAARPLSARPTATSREKR